MALRRRVRAVRSRHPMHREGGEGVREGANTHTPIDPLPSQNIDQKSLPAPAPTAVTSAITREDAWRAAGDIEATIVGRPLNARILDILLPSGEKTRAVANPIMAQRFGRKRPIWVKKDARGKLYEVVGHYSQWGVRTS